MEGHCALCKLQLLKASPPLPMQARTNTLWLILTIPDRPLHRSWGAHWGSDRKVQPKINEVLRSSGAVHPRGPALVLDVQAISKGLVHGVGALHMGRALHII